MVGGSRDGEACQRAYPGFPCVTAAAEIFFTQRHSSTFSPPTPRSHHQLPRRLINVAHVFGPPDTQEVYPIFRISTPPICFRQSKVSILKLCQAYVAPSRLHAGSSSFHLRSSRTSGEARLMDFRSCSLLSGWLAMCSIFWGPSCREFCRL